MFKSLFFVSFFIFSSLLINYKIFKSWKIKNANVQTVIVPYVIVEIAKKTTVLVLHVNAKNAVAATKRKVSGMLTFEFFFLWILKPFGIN